MIDTDIGLRNLDVVMGLENRIVYNLVDVVEGNCRIKQALIKDKRYPNLCLLPSAQTRDKSSVTPEQMVKLIEDLREDFDYILLDCPAGIEQGFKNAIQKQGRCQRCIYKPRNINNGQTEKLGRDNEKPFPGAYRVCDPA